MRGRSRRARTAAEALALLALAAILARPVAASTRAWWAHVPLDSLRPTLPPTVTRAAVPRAPADTLERPAVVEVVGIGARPRAALRPGPHQVRSARGRAASAAGAAPGRLEPWRAWEGRVQWQAAPGPGPIVHACGEPEWLEQRGDSAVFDSVVYWRCLAERDPRSAAAVRRVAALALADGDTLAADSILADPALGRSVWAWPVLRQRMELALARGDTAGADRLLEHADRADWPDAERAAWLDQRVRLRGALGDTARAVEFARQAVRVYPAQAGARRALEQLAGLQAARRETPTIADERAAAEVEVFAGRAGAAVARLRRLLERTAGRERAEVALRLCAVLRSTRHFSDARAVATAALGDSVPDGLRDRLRLEQARAELGAGRPDSALACYERMIAGGEAVGEAAWEAGRAAEDAGRWADALRWYARVPATAARASRARFRAGLMHIALGDADSAAACWQSDSTEAGRFWRGVALRAQGDTAAGGALLREVAAVPGYSFYRAAARDTLGLRGWPGGLAAASCPDDSVCAALAEVAWLAARGLEEDAALLLARWVAGDRRAIPSARAPVALECLTAARHAYGLGRVGLAIGLSERARESDASLDGWQRWSVAPWAYPPAYESLFVAPRDSVTASLEPALLFAVTYQESQFDARARSRSDALGLMQLKLETASDMAKLARDPVPTEAALFDPARNVRYGARYLGRLLRRCDGSVAAALCAYNAGAGRLARSWRELRVRGGEALVCELAANPLAQDYARRILGHRAAYRELRPTAAP